jgi:hypothetical protein
MQIPDIGFRRAALLTVRDPFDRAFDGLTPRSASNTPWL